MPNGFPAGRRKAGEPQQVEGSLRQGNRNPPCRFIVPGQLAAGAVGSYGSLRLPSRCGNPGAVGAGFRQGRHFPLPSARSIAATGFACLLPARGESGQCAGCPELKPPPGAVGMMLVPNDHKYLGSPAGLPELVPNLPLSLVSRIQLSSGGHARIDVGKDGSVTFDSD